MLKEDLMKMLANVPDGADIPVQPTPEPPAEPLAESPVEPSKTPNDATVTITAAEFMRMVEAYAQQHNPQPEAEKEKKHAEVYLY